MALITRFSALLKADAHAVLDQIEDPLQVLQQSIRDMRAETELSEKSIDRLEQQISQLKTQHTDGQQAVERLAAQLDDALTANRDDLARSVIRHRLQQELMNEAVDRQRRAREAQLDDVRQAHESQCRELVSMEQKLQLFSQQRPTHSRDSVSARTISPSVSAEQVELELVRLKNQRSAT